MSDKSENLKLWDAVCQTDPTFTKPFSRGGGFKGTAIAPHYLVWKATQMFGPIGTGWGFHETQNLIAEGVWFSRVQFWYRRPDGEIGNVEQWGATTFVGTNKNGQFVDEEAAKKAVTDGMTKCLSYLGFAADVHMGRYDDNKYVAELHNAKRAGKLDRGDIGEEPEDCKPDPEKREAILKTKLAQAEQAQKETPTSGDLPPRPASPKGTPTFGEMMDAFKKIKAGFIELGREADYYEVLEQHKFNNSKEVVEAGPTVARKVAIDLNLRLQLLRSTSEVNANANA